MSRPVRILFLSSHYGIGAAESLWLETAAHLAAQGHQVHAAVCWLKWSEDRLSKLRQLGIPVTSLAQAWPRHRLLRPFFRSGQTERLLARRLVKAASPDLVLISQGNDHSCLPWAEALHELQVPVAVVTHGLVPADWPKDAMALRLQKAFAKLAASFWVSRRNQHDFECQTGARLANGQCVWNPIKVLPSGALPWPETNGAWKMACVARLQTRPKGHDLLIQALAEPRWKERNLTLSFFGDGENRQGLEKLARMLGIADRVVFPGHVERVEDIWRDHHLLVQPSRNEGMPLSLIEALICARPALATDVAGHAEIIRDGVDGFIAEAPTVRHIDSALETAWQQRSAWREMGMSARNHLLELLPADPVADFADRLLALIPKR